MAQANMARFFVATTTDENIICGIGIFSAIFCIHIF